LTHYAKGTKTKKLLLTAKVVFNFNYKYFISFPYSTGALSAKKDFFRLEDGAPVLKQVFTKPVLLVFIFNIYRLLEYNQLCYSTVKIHIFI